MVTESEPVWHVSLKCRLQQDTPHLPCAGTCDGHSTGGLCGKPCECWCHRPVFGQIAAGLAYIRDRYGPWRRGS